MVLVWIPSPAPWLLFILERKIIIDANSSLHPRENDSHSPTQSSGISLGGKTYECGRPPPPLMSLSQSDPFCGRYLGNKYSNPVQCYSKYGVCSPPWGSFGMLEASLGGVNICSISLRQTHTAAMGELRADIEYWYQRCSNLRPHSIHIDCWRWIGPVMGEWIGPVAATNPIILGPIYPSPCPFCTSVLLSSPVSVCYCGGQAMLTDAVVSVIAVKLFTTVACLFRQYKWPRGLSWKTKPRRASDLFDIMHSLGLDFLV